MNYIGIESEITAHKLKRAVLVAVALMVVVLVLYGAFRSNEAEIHIVSLQNKSRKAPAYWWLTEKLKCKNPICTEFLAKEDMGHFKDCGRQIKVSKEPERFLGCRFMNAPGRDPVALASYPGSGNTWVRGLLQDVSGLCTGGIYCDPSLKKRGFPGERIANGTVLVVKSHQTDPW